MSAIINSHFQISEESLRYQARTALADLANEIAATRNLETQAVVNKIERAYSIIMWLMALDVKYFLTAQQREKIWWSLIEISQVYDFPTAPVLEERPRPTILVGIQGPPGPAGSSGSGGGVPFTGTSINGTTTVDTFAISLGSGCVWQYSITDGTANQRTGTIEATWLPSGLSVAFGGDISTLQIGDTSAVQLSIDISGGNVRLRVTATGTTFTVKGSRIVVI